MLLQLKPVLREKYFVNSIGLFGSIVRDDFTSKSDIDIIVEFSKPVGIEFIDLANYMEVKLKKKVDLFLETVLRKNIFIKLNLRLFMSKREPSLLIEDIIESANKIL